MKCSIPLCSRLPGLLLVLLAGMALFWTTRLACSQILYFQIKFGARSKDCVSSVENRAETAFRMCPANYYLALHMAEQYWHRRGDADNPASVLLDSAHWCARGFAWHPKLSGLHLLQANLLAEHDPKAAVSAWDAYVDWHYWNAHNQAMRVDFHVRAADFTKAAEVLELLRGRRYHAWASGRFREALLADMVPPVMVE